MTLKNFLLLLLLCFLAISGNSQSARFERKDMTNNLSTDTFFCESISLKFTNTSDLGSNELSAYKFQWHFGKPLKTSTTKDSILTNSSEVRMKFDRPGRHVISMIMTLDQDTIGVYRDTIEVRPRPNAWFSVADTFQLGDLKYRFLSGKSPDKTIPYLYKWYLNDTPGKKGAIDSVIHTTANSGTRDLMIYTFSTESETKKFMTLEVHDYKFLYKDEKNQCFETYTQDFRVVRKLFLPTGFTPNNDGHNDFFKVQVNGRDVYSFQVFDSKGILIFKSESNNIIWDGYDMHGKQALAGLYYFIIESVQSPTPVKEVGYVMLLREK